ncbi:hypothetical protein PENTCL1PPCAC_20972, partial [Pristionchus entomophagus]
MTKGTVNEVFLVAAVTGKGNDFGWIDGSEWDYDNLYKDFHVAGLGECLAMDTLGGAGEWMNVNCSSKLPFVCFRQPYLSFPNECSPGPWKEGQIIYSPGYPYNASVPCDYVLTVDKGRSIEVEILMLEANSCCDHLIISDNSSNAIA